MLKCVWASGLQKSLIHTNMAIFLRTKFFNLTLLTKKMCCTCYHPQQSWGKVIFSQASVILFTGGGVCLSACWDTPQDQAGTPHNQAPPPHPHLGTRPPWTRHPPPRTRPPEQIWSMSRWYASYWNAILLDGFMVKAMLCALFIYTGNYPDWLPSIQLCK